MSDIKLSDKTRVRSIDLTVRDLTPMKEFYADLIGLREAGSDENTLYLSADDKLPYIIGLTEDREAKINYRGAPGLFHLALRFVSRKDLANVFLNLFRNNVKFQGFSDHLVSEAIYLSDPEGNGVELYVDKPREMWEWRRGEVVMDTLPLDLSLITAEAGSGDWKGIDAATDLGHVHLNVKNLEAAERFYSGLLGFDVTNYSYPGARFFSAGKYHHHIGTNTWSSGKKIPKPEHANGMKSFTIEIPDDEYLAGIEKLAKEKNLLAGKNKNELLLNDYEGNLVILTN